MSLTRLTEMERHMKIKPDYNKHVLRMFKRFTSLPVVLSGLALGAAGRFFSTTASRRTADGVRQSRVRRRLRGLTPDHAQSAHVAKESVSRELDAMRRR
jgi:hypothetical protein